MKSLAVFLVLSILFTFSLTLETSEGITTSTETPCESKCLACQQTVYNLKFHKKANCKNNHCRTTVLKLFNHFSAIKFGVTGTKPVLLLELFKMIQ
jgi:hypothetical protein